MINNKLTVGITQGDGNGIGYEVIIKALADARILALFTKVNSVDEVISSLFSNVDRTDEISLEVIFIIKCNSNYLSLIIAYTTSSTNISVHSASIQQLLGNSTILVIGYSVRSGRTSIVNNSYLFFYAAYCSVYVVPSASVVKTTLISPILVIFLMSSAQKKYSIPVTALSSFSTPGVPSVLFFAQVVNGEFKSLTKVYKKTDFIRPVNKKVKTATIFVVKNEVIGFPHPHMSNGLDAQ